MFGASILRAVNTMKLVPRVKPILVAVARQEKHQIGSDVTGVPVRVKCLTH